MPERDRTWARDEVFPSYWPNRLAAALSTVTENFRIRRTAGAPTTTIEVPASANTGLAGVGVQGKWRYIEATKQRAHPGGAAGWYDVFVTAKADDIRAIPAANSDFTDYAFELAIVAEGGSPAIVPGTVDLVRGPVGKVRWSGTEIMELRQIVGVDSSETPVRATADVPGEAPIEAIAAAGQTASLMRAGSARDTPDDRYSLTPAGQLVLPVQGATGGLLLGGDATLYRQSAARLRTSGEFFADGDLRAREGNAARVRIGAVGPASEAGVVFGSGDDTYLYRSAAAFLKTDHRFEALRYTAVALVGAPIYRSAQVAAEVVQANYLLTADAQPAFRLFGSGKMEWGAGGATAVDVNLYRSAADTLRTDDNLIVGRALTLQKDRPNNVPVLGAETGLKIVRGYVTGAGAIGDGSGWTVAKNSTGDYTVTFTDAFDDAPACFITIVGTANESRIDSNGTTTLRVKFFNSSGIAEDPTGWYFLAIGPETMAL